MDEEIRELFDSALDQAPAPAQPAQPDQTDQAVVDYAIANAAANCGAVDPELVERLLREAPVAMDQGEVTGLGQALETLRQTRPYLFADYGGRPQFAAPTHGRSLSREEEAVAQRYRNNPWYRK